jgi:hypothetical protein
MNNVTCAWVNTNENDFESFIPLQFIGQRYKKLGYKNDCNILFLQGYDRLSRTYTDSLLSLGYRLHDVSKMYTEIAKPYSQLDLFKNTYRKNTFLQWLVMEHFFAGDPIIHYDGDIILNEDPAVIAQKVSGKTFILQGCPAFAAVSNREWFYQYKSHLLDFANNMQTYADNAWKERDGWEVTFKTRWAGSRFSKIFLHDQDLMSHLIHTGRLIQDPIEDILMQFQDYILFENPLFIHFYDENFPYTYVRENDVDYFLCERQDAEKCEYKKRILFWHLQSCFNFYLAKYMLRRKFFRFLPMGRLNLNLAPKGVEDFINKKLAPYLQHTTRLNVYKYYFDQSDFGGILTNRVWWKEGTFK